MSSQRYRALLSYLPGMAAVVNMFQSQDVQKKVYDELMSALDEKLDSEGSGTDSRGLTKKSPIQALPAQENGELAHELVDGGSIHADLPRL